MEDSPKFFVRNLIGPCSLQRLWKLEVCVTQIMSCFVVIGSPGFGSISYSYPVKVKVTLEEATKNHKLYSFFYLGARWVLLANATLRPLYPRQS